MSVFTQGNSRKLANLGYAFYLAQKYSVDFVKECSKQKLKWFIRTLRDKPRNIVLETISSVQTAFEPDLVECWVAGTRRIASRLYYSEITISLDKTIRKAMLVPDQVLPCQMSPMSDMVGSGTIPYR